MRARSLIQIASGAECLALAGGAAVLLLQAADAGAALEFRRSLAAAEPWRLLTGHLVHLNWRHALLNVIAWLAVARLFSAELTARRQMVVIGASAAGISALFLLLCPQLAWYRGLSGVLHALFAAGAVDALIASDRGAARRLPAALLAGVWLKVLAEQRFGSAIELTGWLGVTGAAAATVITQAHLYGTVIGTLTALALRRPGAGAMQPSSRQPSRPASGC